MKIIMAICVLMFSGCTIKVVDERTTREEIMTAFQQRDQVLIKHSKDIEALKKPVGVKK